MRIKLSATVPVVQYGNLMPEVELEHDNYEEGMAQAEAYITSFWNNHVEAGKRLQTSQGKKLEAFVGGSINYDDVAHIYTNDEGEVYLSGSQYAKQFEKPFNKEAIAAAIAKKFDVSASDVIAMWDLKAKASMTFGTSLHAALELYERFGRLAASIDKETHHHDQYNLKRIVQSFYEAHKGEKAKTEVLVVDHNRKWAGQIDRLIITGENKCIVTDFKTGSDMPKTKQDVYWRQLSFYAAIMQAGGWVVEGLELYHWDGQAWVTYKSEVLAV